MAGIMIAGNGINYKVIIIIFYIVIGLGGVHFLNNWLYTECEKQFKKKAEEEFKCVC